MAAEEFVVHPDSLHGYAGLLERNNGHVGHMQDYVNGACSQTKGLMGVMFIFQNMAEDLASWQRNILNQMNQRLADTTRGLRQTATDYTRTDAKSAAAMDKTMPTAPDHGTGPGRGPI